MTSKLFVPWTNCLDQDPKYITEEKKVLTKVEYKYKQKVEKQIEVKTYTISKPVTKAFKERQFQKPFGIGKGEDDIRQNITLTSVQRENVWHPYYEIKMEEEDLKDKFLKSKAEKQYMNMQVTDISALEEQLKKNKEAEIEEQKKQEDLASGKRVFDPKKIIEERKKQQEQEETKKVEDKLTIRVKNLPNDIQEEDLRQALARFGYITRIRIMYEELRNGRKRCKGFGYVSFQYEDSAKRALEEGEVTVDMATIEIEKAMQRFMAPRENMVSQENKRAFEQLSRRK